MFCVLVLADYEVPRSYLQNEKNPSNYSSSILSHISSVKGRSQQYEKVTINHQKP